MGSIDTPSVKYQVFSHNSTSPADGPRFMLIVSHCILGVRHRQLVPAYGPGRHRADTARVANASWGMGRVNRSKEEEELMKRDS